MDRSSHHQAPHVDAIAQAHAKASGWTNKATFTSTIPKTLGRQTHTIAVLASRAPGEVLGSSQYGQESAASLHHPRSTVLSTRGLGHLVVDPDFERKFASRPNIAGTTGGWPTNLTPQHQSHEPASLFQAFPDKVSSVYQLQAFALH